MRKGKLIKDTSVLDSRRKGKQIPNLAFCNRTVEIIRIKFEESWSHCRSISMKKNIQLFSGLSRDRQELSQCHIQIKLKAEQAVTSSTVFATLGIWGIFVVT